MPPSLRQFAFTAVASLLFIRADLRAQQAAPAAPNKLALTAALVLTPEFCATVKKVGSALVNQEKFDVGKEACKQLEPGLATVFTELKRVADSSETAGAQVVIEPKFADVGATQKAFAFSKRELVVVVEWTIRDRDGKVLWLETIDGSAKRNIGNAFTHGKNMKHIVEDAVQNVTEESAAKMISATQLQKYSAKPIK
jgi:hypothetical protein